MRFTINVLAIVFIFMPLAWSAPLFNTAIASYTMEDTTGGILQDYSPNNHDSNNGLGGTTIVTGQYGNALQFDGTDQIRIASDASLTKTTAFTIEASFRVDGYTNGDWVRVVGKGDATYRNYGLWYLSSGTFLFQIYGTPGSEARYNVGINLGQWYHMAGVYTGTSMLLYLDGVLVAQTNSSVSPYTNTEPLTIGGADFHTKHIGLIDNVALFNGALTAQDIQRHSQGLDVSLPVPEASSLLLLSLAFAILMKKKYT